MEPRPNLASAQRLPEPRPNLAPLRLAVAGFLVVSFLFAGYSILCRSTSSRMTLGDTGSDHLSHANAAVLFFYRGCDVYRLPVNQLLESATSPEATFFSVREGWGAGDLYRLPERARPDVPLFLNWAQLARVYPPGLYLYTLPEALGLEYTDLPLWTISAFSLLKYSLVAHLLLWCLFDYLLLQYPWGEKLLGVPGWVLLPVLLAAVQVQVCFWTLAGFYDGAALLFLVLMLTACKRRLWSHALFFYAVAVFFHFRSLWFFPLAGLTLVYLAREVLQQGLPRLRAPTGRRQMCLAACGLALLAVSAVFFVVGYPAMTRFPLNNPLHLKAINREDLPWTQLALLALLLGVMALRRDWLLLASLAGVLFFLVNTRQVQHWHSLSLLPLILCSRHNSLAGLCSGALGYGILSSVFFQVVPFDPVWARLYYVGR